MCTCVTVKKKKKKVNCPWSSWGRNILVYRISAGERGVTPSHNDKFHSFGETHTNSEWNNYKFDYITLPQQTFRIVCVCLRKTRLLNTKKKKKILIYPNLLCFTYKYALRACTHNSIVIIFVIILHATEYANSQQFIIEVYNVLVVITAMPKKKHGPVTFFLIRHGTLNHNWTGRQMGQSFSFVCLLHVLVVLTIIRCVCVCTYMKGEYTCGIREECCGRRRAREKKWRRRAWTNEFFL